MKTFSRLNLFALVFLGLTIMLFGSATEVHAQATSDFSLAVTSDVDPTPAVLHPVGTQVTVTFTPLGKNNIPPTTPVDITVDVTELTDVMVNGSQVTTFPITVPTMVGNVQVIGKLPADDMDDINIVVSGVWKDKQAENSVEFYPGEDDVFAPITIVVNPPDPKQPLAVGDNFKQTITIENMHDRYSTLRLSAWQMDIVYNPAILAVVSVTKGDFLESKGDETLFIANQSRGRISAGQALAGQAAGVATAPSPPGISLAPGDPPGDLITIEFRLLAYAEEALGIHNTLLQSDQDADEDGIPDRISYSIMVKDVAVATMHETYIYAKEDVNQDEMVNIHDLMAVAASIGTMNPRADINGDGYVDILDLVLIYTSNLWAQPAPKTLDQSFSRAANSPEPPPAPSIDSTLDSTTIQSWIEHAQLENDGSEIFQRGIPNLESLLKSIVPNQTKLLTNYPNPFNPETWIPYQLSETTNVTVTIHAMNGSLIRTLNLGHQTPGSYISKSQAAYWDGRNEFGEHSASGLYFYTFTAGKYTATGKMLILK